jgi:methylenetetrahydrofolate reductase (NADPH)
MAGPAQSESGRDVVALFGKTGATGTSETRAYRLSLVEMMIFELIPLKSGERGIEALPSKAEVSVTALPVKGMSATVALTDRIRALGHHPTPHISARLVESRQHCAELARWTRSEGHGKVFVVAGDAKEPHGPYEGAHAFLRDFLEMEHGAAAVGVTSYPDGHPIISRELCREHLHMKQALITDAGLEGWASTQMCFDTDRIVKWLRSERDAGLTLPIHLGIPGVVDRTKLMTMGARLGIGASLRFLNKNRAVVTKLLTRGAYDPDDILDPMIDDLAALGIAALHVFTFNQVEATEQWRQVALPGDR